MLPDGSFVWCVRKLEIWTEIEFSISYNPKANYYVTLTKISQLTGLTRSNMPELGFPCNLISKTGLQPVSKPVEKILGFYGPIYKKAQKMVQMYIS